MEFLTTPDFASGIPWVAPTPAANNTNQGATNPDSTLPSLPPLPTTSSAPSAIPPPSTNLDVLPSTALFSTPNYFGSATPRLLDRAGIKSSFQSLFSPNVSNNDLSPAGISQTNQSHHAGGGQGQASLQHVPGFPVTPGMPTHAADTVERLQSSAPGIPSSSMPGLTPFLGSFNTPSLVPPPTSLFSNFQRGTPERSNHLSASANQSTPHSQNLNSLSNNPDVFLTSPYLQAAAKEAVRREFLNMPTYVATSKSSAPVPSAPIASSSTHPTTTAEKLSSLSPVNPVPASTSSGLASRPEKTLSLSPSSQEPLQTETLPTSSVTPSPPPDVDDDPPHEHSNNVPMKQKSNDATASVSASTLGEKDNALVGHENHQKTSSSSSVSTVNTSTAQPLPNAAAVPGASMTMPQMAPSHQPSAPYFMAHPHPHGGMMFVGPHGHVMMAAPGMQQPGAPHAFYHPAHAYNMMMFGAQHPMMHAQHAHLMMHNPAAAAAAVAAAAAAASNHSSAVPQHQAVAASVQTAHHSQSTLPVPTDAASQAQRHGLSSGLPGSSGGTSSGIFGDGESRDEDGTGTEGYDLVKELSADKKIRVEQEKQDLIREFKKKTREAALVRFRQKRSERRFGKLIRYDCRKKLADARPRVKGRFVRTRADELGEDEFDCAQVVPDYMED